MLPRVSPSLRRPVLQGRPFLDELLTYHYLEAEFFRFSRTTPQQYWSLSKPDRADAIWQALFVENTPMSEAARGIVFVLDAFALPTDSPDLAEARAFFQKQNVAEHVLKALQMAGVSSVVMTNDPLDREEMQLWMSGAQRHPQFQPVLRLDRILREWSEPWDLLVSLGYEVDNCASGKSIGEIRRFLADWYERMQPVYMAVSLPDTFQFPEDTRARKDPAERRSCPRAVNSDLPLSLMIGVRRQVNPTPPLGRRRSR